VSFFAVSSKGSASGTGGVKVGFDACLYAFSIFLRADPIVHLKSKVGELLPTKKLMFGTMKILPRSFGNMMGVLNQGVGLVFLGLF
jgi:hypothetical protein